MKNILILICTCMMTQTSFAQFEINGTIKDKNGTLAFATVTLLDTTQIVSYDISDDNGKFSLKAAGGNYILEVNILGYETKKDKISLTKNLTLDNILLESASQDLDEVVVKAKIPLIERKPDRLIFNVSESVAAAGGDALDALQAAPGLLVTNDAISMIGKGASRVMVDGRILQLSGEDLINFLNSISADDIQKIEIISNPPAKYEAGSSGGLINIVYKKGVNDFWKSYLTFSNTKQKYNYASLRGNFIYNKDKVSLRLSASGKTGDIREVETWETRYANGPRETFIEAKEKQDGVSGRFALDYQLTDKTSIGVQYLGNFTEPDIGGITTTNIFDANHNLDSLYETTNFNDKKRASHVGNIHLVSKLDTFGKSVSFDVDYFSFDNQLDRYYTVNTYDAKGNFLNINQAATNYSLQSIDNYSAKVDFEHPTDFAKLSYGAKVSYTKTINDLENYNNISGEAVFDPALSNVFQYTENVQAAYLSGSKAFSDKLEMQVGLRLENTKTIGFSETLDQTNENEYLKLFPTVYLSYTKNQDNLFSLNYGRRINRPWFRNLNPFRIYANTNNYSEGYPFLQPSFADNIEFNFTHKQVFTTIAHVGVTKNASGVIFSADNETNVQAIIRRNYYTGYVAEIGEVYTFNKLPWWESQNQLFLIGFKSVVTNPDVDIALKNGMQVFASTYNTFSVGKNTKLTLNFWYASAHKRGLSSMGERYSLDLGIRRYFFDKKLQLSLYARDIFDTGSTNNMLSEVNGVEVNFGMNYSRRYLRFSATYNFGNNKINVRERRFGNAEESGRAG